MKRDTHRRSFVGCGGGGGGGGDDGGGGGGISSSISSVGMLFTSASLSSPTSSNFMFTLQLATGLSVVSLLKSLLSHQFWIHGIRCGMHTQIALTSHVLRAAMNANHQIVGSSEFDTGKLLNLLSTDTSKISDSNVIPAFHWGTWGPCITMVVVIYNLHQLLGSAAFCGIFVTMLFSFLGVWIGKSIKRAAALTVAKRDVRSNLLEQMLRSMRLVKSFTWEDTMKSAVTSARNEEMVHQRWQQTLSMISAAPHRLRGIPKSYEAMIICPPLDTSLFCCTPP